jgi:hypothetical protein
MPTYSLDGDTTGLPRTRRSGIPYEIEALTPREVWGAGNGAHSIVCRQWWDGSAAWIRDMVGEVTVVKPGSQLLLKRHIPEHLRYDDGRVQFCTMVDQQGQYGNDEGENFAQAVSRWPQTKWYVTRATFEAMPWAILHDTETTAGLPSVAEIQAGAGANAGAIELYRYVIRNRRNYSREQPIPGPGGDTTSYFSITTPPKKIPGGIVFRGVGYSDVQYRWVRVPVGWPPPPGWVPPDPSNPWPPRFNPTATTPASNRRTRDSFEGCVNDDWFDVAAPDGYAWPPGTLLYLGYDDSNKYYDAAGDWVCDVVFNFKAKQALDADGSYGNWNQYLNAAGVWKEVSADVVPGDNKHGTTDGKRPYASKNFNDLFQAT